MMQGNSHRDYTRTVRVAAIQMVSENGCVASNLAHAILLVEQRYWIERREAEGNICGAEVNTGQISSGVEILLPVSHNF